MEKTHNVISLSISAVRYAKFESIQYFIDINILQNHRIDINIFQIVLIDIVINIFTNYLREEIISKGAFSSVHWPN